MLFGLVNSSNSFQNFIIDILKNNILDLFVSAYVNNILIFSKTFQKQRKYVKTVLACFKAASL